MKIETAEWLAEINLEIGANLYRLKDLKNDLEILRSPDSLDQFVRSPETYGIPVLFPPNRIDAGKFVWNGRAYQFPVNETERNNHLHGLILGQEWKLEEKTAHSVRMSFSFDESKKNFKYFPHRMLLTLSYEFTADKVNQTFTVENLSKESIPVGLGYHTAFRTYGETSKVFISAGDGLWEVQKPRYLATGKLLPWTDETAFHLPGGFSADEREVSMHCPAAETMLDGKAFHGAVIYHPEKKLSVHYETSKNLRHWYLWNRGGHQGFFCVEPMSWMINSPNLAIPHETSGLIALSHGEKTAFTSSISVSFT